MAYVIGYGSLMEPKDLARTCSGASLRAPVRVDGYRRHLNLLGSSRVDPLSGRASTVANVEAAPGSWFAALLIEVPEEQMPALDRREGMYEPVTLVSRHFETDAPQPEARIYVCDRPHSPVPWDLAVFHHYLGLCLAGAAAWGADFLQAFLHTTDADGIPLSEHPEFQALRKAGHFPALG